MTPTCPAVAPSRRELGPGGTSHGGSRHKGESRCPVPPAAPDSGYGRHRPTQAVTVVKLWIVVDRYSSPGRRTTVG